ncbi:hypothetical protein RWE15_23970 [Virgibacillus halophilus]|uniref:Uncharacterized protein n=1 Tax=Tigheibacillus halophilus TaxID=361280 RepID=A0ABU5CBU0_9BACI|nr:hypothetical protein [Virgibacillus halophilus]
MKKIYTLISIKNQKEKLDKLMKTKSLDDLPSEYKGKYPTYERHKGLYPKQFKKDMDELIRLYDPIINEDETDVTDKEWDPLESFLKQYGGDDAEYPFDYKQNGKYFLTNSFMDRAIKTFNSLKSDIDDGHIDADTIDGFNSVKENAETFD